VASTYVAAGAYQTVKVISQTEVAPVEAVKIYTQPHASFVIVLVPLAEFQANDYDKYLTPVAATIEGIWTDGFISGTAFVQVTDQSTNLLADFLDFTVSYTPTGGLALPFTGVVRAPTDALSSATAFATLGGAQAPGPQIATLYNTLVALATGTPLP
jgi:hypothetical protein